MEGRTTMKAQPADHPLNGLLRTERIPHIWCPGCGIGTAFSACLTALLNSGMDLTKTAMVSGIGCSGRAAGYVKLDSYHTTHGRAIPFATGMKLARPELNVVVFSGDGDLFAIGGNHFIHGARRNVDLTVVCVNNFNYGMTGGQCSATTPREAQVESGFLNRLEAPLDICRVAAAAGAGFAARVSGYDPLLSERMQQAIRHDGFALVDIWGICPGRYGKRNPISPGSINAALDRLPDLTDTLAANARDEYGRAYREEAAKLVAPAPPALIEARFPPPQGGRREILLLGSAGQRIITAGEILCLAAATAGLHATQKNDYPITVMRGHSVSEVVCSDRPIDYTGIDRPNLVVALAQEGVARKAGIFRELGPDTVILKARDVSLPDTSGTILELDFKALGIRSQDRALAALGELADRRLVLTRDMLGAALQLRFSGRLLDAALKQLEAGGNSPAVVG